MALDRKIIKAINNIESYVMKIRLLVKLVLNSLQTDINDSNINWTSPNEIIALRKGAKKTRNPIRNELIILMLYRHGLRESELCKLKLSDLILDESKIYISRMKGSNDFVHPIEGDELRLIHRYLNTRAN